ncbi:hypothetical protein [Commensalibacter papalotli (ex Botero et al. 2024)]|uniref:hypothetical protein n=1 Tax=Commensalibacter papalotli (ex Botero et al. 2024) TaxID=2972766 RepID=UPI0024906B87|nr:hypothetical protein [Commensalibacter papalotli (ex Botero et al. 2024)]
MGATFEEIIPPAVASKPTIPAIAPNPPTITSCVILETTLFISVILSQFYLVSLFCSTCEELSDGVNLPPCSIFSLLQSFASSLFLGS